MNFVCKLNENNYMKKCANKYEPVTFGYDEVCLRFVTNTKPFTEAEVSFQFDNLNF